MTTDPFALTQSPRTQGFEQQGSPASEDDLFTQSFSDLAYRTFAKSHPELLQHLVTFRILEVEPSEGEGVGAFILKMTQEVLFVPAVIAENAIKPLDMFYSRTKDRFFPLTQEWVDHISTDSRSPIGDGVAPPKDLATDVDIRNVMIPPTTGRYSYASDHDTAWAPFATDLQRDYDEPLIFPEVLSKLSNAHKQEMQGFLVKNASLLRKMAEVYGVNQLRDALTPVAEKVATGGRTEVDMKKNVYLATASTPLAEVKKEVGGDISEAYKAIRYRGFYVKDRRKSTPNSVFSFTEERMRLVTPEHPGMYEIYLSDGTTSKALVVPNPIHLHPGRSDHDRMRHGDYNRRTLQSGDASSNDHGFYPSHAHSFFVLLEDKRCGVVENLVGEPLMSVSHEEVEDFLKKHSVESPKSNSEGSFISTAGWTVRATLPSYVREVSEKKDMLSCKALDVTIVISKKMTGGKLIRPVGEATIVLPGTYRWVAIDPNKRLSAQDILSSPQMVERMLEAQIEKTGATRIKIAKTMDGMMVAGAPCSALEAIVKVANVYDVSVNDATLVVEGVHGDLPVNAWAMPKLADARADQQAQDAQAQAQQMAAMQAPPAPPPPSGMDLALAEKLQMIQSQRAALDQMESMLSEIQGRAQGIDQGGGAMAAPQAAAGMAAGPQTQMMGGPAMAPVPGMDPSQGMPQGQPGMDPSQGMPQGQPGMDPSQGMPQGQPGMDPSQGMPQGQPGMDPSQGMAQGQPGMDPSQGMAQPPPQPVMPGEPNAALFDQQVSPQFLGDAAKLDHEGVFDAAAVASLAHVRSIKDILRNYLPTLDNAMDRLGRTLLLIYVKSSQIKERIGDEAFVQLEQTLQDVFAQMGDAIMSLNQYGSQLAPNNARRT